MHKSAHNSISRKEITHKQRARTPCPTMPSFTKTMLNSDALMKNYVYNLVKNMYPKRPNFFNYESESENSESSSSNSSFENISPTISIERDLLKLLKVIKPLQPRSKNYYEKINRRRGAVVFLNLDETI